MPDDVASLARGILHDPLRVEVTPQATTAERVTQRVVFVEKADKPRALFSILDDPAIDRALVFTRTKHGADKVARLLRKEKFAAEAIHGNKSQSARVKALDGFRDGDIPILVATDIAARGIDVPGITHVINYDVPNVPESYVHRIGRTARAGESGMAISLCGGDEREYLRDIEKIIRAKIPTLDRLAPRVSKAAPDTEPEEEDRRDAPRQRSHPDQNRAQHGRPQHGQPAHPPRPAQSRPSTPAPRPAHPPQRPARSEAPRPSGRRRGRGGRGGRGARG
jgi:ATP-dependent RNA helicase RhlE